MLDEPPTGLRQPDAECVPLEHVDAKVFLQRLQTGADARHPDTERVPGMAEVEMFGDSDNVAQGDERDAPEAIALGVKVYALVSPAPAHDVQAPSSLRAPPQFTL